MEMSKTQVFVGVAVMLLSEGKVLMGRTGHPGKSAGFKEGWAWTLPGGKVEHSENLHSAAMRELKEETGMGAESLRLVSVGTDIVSGVHFVTIGFESERFCGNPEAKEPDKISEWRWFDLKSPPENTFTPSLSVIKNFLSGDICADGG